MKRIILGSNSPRRRELMQGLDLAFTVDTGNTFEEHVPPGTAPRRVPLLLAEGKSHGFHRPLEADEVLVTADTVVIVDDEVLGKPHSREEAIAMLQALSGRTHEVVTGVAIRDCRKEKSFTNCTRVRFSELTPSQIAYYVDRYKPYDKAGAYAIQEWIGYIAIGYIEGSFYNVMGFPVDEVYRELQAFL